jgi:hypothetical protein
MGILRKYFLKVCKRGNAGHRPGVAQHQWGMGRVNSFITGSGGARKQMLNYGHKQVKPKRERKRNKIKKPL